MASTFANNGTRWRIRSDGNELNGGGFDQFVTGAGTDYTDQATPLIDSTTGTCTVGSTTWTDASANFPSDVVGNVLRVSAKTGGTATALDYFVVTAWIDANNLTLDRSPCASTNITAATYRIGGAFASFKQFASAATGSMGTPALATPLLPGNQIYIRGDGSLVPAAATYDWTAGAGTWTCPDGARLAAGQGEIQIVGYNGRPRIDHCGWTIRANGWTFKSIVFFRKLNTVGGAFHQNASSGGTGSVAFCSYDQNGYDDVEFQGAYGNVLFCMFVNTGGGTAGTVAVCQLIHPASAIIGCVFRGLRGPAIRTSSNTGTNATTFAEIGYNYITDCLSDGILIYISNLPYCYAVFNNTIANNAGDGVKLLTGAIACTTLFNNIISGNGGYGVSSADSATLNRRLKRMFMGYNNVVDNASGNFDANLQADPTDISVDPGFANALGGNYATGAAMQGVGLSGMDGYLGAAPNLINIGAYQGVPISLASFGLSDGYGLSPYEGLSID